MLTVVATPVLILALNPLSAASQRPCEWCVILMEGTEIVGYGCNSSSGDWPVIECIATIESCEGEFCWPEEQLPDLTTVAVLDSCHQPEGPLGSRPVVLSDLWRGARFPVQKEDGSDALTGRRQLTPTAIGGSSRTRKPDPR